LGQLRHFGYVPVTSGLSPTPDMALHRNSQPYVATGDIPYHPQTELIPTTEIMVSFWPFLLNPNNLQPMLTVFNSRVDTLLFCLVWLLAISAGPAFADDEQVWAALRQGGKVVLLRHTHVDMQEGIGHLAPGNCAEEVNLSPRGIEQAKRIGEAFRDHGIMVGEVLTSPYCRCIDTGKLAFGRATPVKYLMPPGVSSDSQATLNQERVLQGARSHRSSANLVMITHDLNISNVVLEPSIAMGDFFVLQPNGTDFDVIGKIRMGDK
jgi:phosphohistidine phosphatase SixA